MWETGENPGEDLGADYMRVFSPGWNFSPPNRAENSAPLCSQLFVKLTLRLHEKFSARAEKPARAGISALLELSGLGFSARVNGLRFLI